MDVMSWSFATDLCRSETQNTIQYFWYLLGRCAWHHPVKSVLEPIKQIARVDALQKSFSEASRKQQYRELATNTNLGEVVLGAVQGFHQALATEKGTTSELNNVAALSAP